MSNACPNCGGDADDNWFDRCLCPCDGDGIMHTRCGECGYALDGVSSMMKMKPDPPLRQDGCCAQCRGERKGPSERAHKRYVDAGHYELDPFCSSDCCKEWHGCVPPKPAVGALGYEPPVRIRRHGTTTMYKRGGCRCDECRAAIAKAKREQRQRAAAAAC